MFLQVSRHYSTYMATKFELQAMERGLDGLISTLENSSCLISSHKHRKILIAVSAARATVAYASGKILTTLVRCNC